MARQRTPDHHRRAPWVDEPASKPGLIRADIAVGICIGLIPGFVIGLLTAGLL